MHKKSKLGCANCKIRSVKCDESRPSCRPCRAFGVSCRYDVSTESQDVMLRPGCSTIRFDAPAKVSYELPSPLPVSASSDGRDVYRLSALDVGQFERFSKRIFASLAGGASGWWEKMLPATFEVCVLASAFILMDVVVQGLLLGTDTRLRSTSNETG
jgi:hypothetical protein